MRKVAAALFWRVGADVQWTIYRFTVARVNLIRFVGHLSQRLEVLFRLSTSNRRKEENRDMCENSHVYLLSKTEI